MSTRKQKEPPYLPMPPDATPLQIMIEVEERIRTMGTRVSDAADDFKFWLREQGPAVHELVATVDLTQQVYSLYENISGRAGGLHDRIRATTPKAIPDAIAMLELCDPPVDKVADGLRAIAEKRGAA